MLLLLVLTGFGAMAYHLQGTSEARHLDAELQLRISALLGNIAHQLPPEGERTDFPDDPPEAEPGRRPRPGTFRLRPELAPLFAPGSDVPFYYRLWTRDGAVFGTSANAPADLRRPGRSPGGGVTFRSEDGRREAVDVTPPGECVLVGVSEAAQEREMLRFAGEFAAVGTAVIALGLAGGLCLASRAIRPVEVISAIAARIAGGRMDERIPISGNGSELDRLASVLNRTFAQFDAAFAEQAHFTSDAAHELRTPVSVIRRDDKRTSPPSRLYFTALASRLVQICARRSGSARQTAGSSSSRKMIPRSAASGWMRSICSRPISARSQGCRRAGSECASSRASARSDSMRLCIRNAERRVISMLPRYSSGSRGRASAS